MRYLFCLIFLITSYAFPYIMSFGVLSWLDKNEPPNLGGVVLIYLVYIIFYILRFFTFILVALISFCFRNYFILLYKYNSLFFLVLFIVDVILCHILDPLLGTSYFKTEGFFCYIGFLSLSATYFPFWLVFGIRNLIHYIKDLKNKKSE